MWSVDPSRVATFDAGTFAAPIMLRRAMERNALGDVAMRGAAYKQSPEYNALAAHGGPTVAAANALEGAVEASKTPTGRAHLHDEADKLAGVNPQLASLFRKLAERGAPKFGVSEGLRDVERQKQMVAQGKSQTMNSRHLHGNAVDIHLIGPDGKPDWTFDRYRDFYENHVSPLAAEMGVPVEWGGNWKTLKDGVHFQIGGANRTAQSFDPLAHLGL